MGFASSIIGTRELATAASVMLSVGAFTLITAPLGLLSAVAVYPSVTLTYMILAFFMCLVSVVGGWFSYQLYNETDSGVVLKWMNYSLLSEYGNPFANDLTLSWDELHEKYGCCGITDENGAVEWQNSQWFITYDRWPRPRTPESCCPTCETKVSVGCYDPLLSDLQYYSLGIVLISSVMAFLCLINAGLCFLVHESSLSHHYHDEALLL
ncbi:tetraspanin family protein [Ostertagia ostertagi]